MFSIAYAAESNWNESHWKHDKFNQLLKAARAEIDEARRRDMYVEMQSITRDEGGSIIDPKRARRRGHSYDHSWFRGL